MADDKKLIFKTAYLYFQEGRWDKAIVEFKRLVSLDPEDLTARNMLGDAFMKKGAMKEAYDEYAYSAEGYSKKGEGEKANAIYKKMSKLEIHNLDAAQQKKLRVIALIVRGDGAYEAGNYEESALAYQEVANIDPANMEVTGKLADIYARLGRNKEAAQHYFAVAKFYLENRLFKRALIFYQKVVELEPSNVDARMALGDLLAREGQELEARKEFQSVAEFFIAQGELDKAQACCQKAIGLKSIDAHWLLGDIYLRRQQYDEAKSELETFLKIKANHIPAQYSLGVCLQSKGSLDEALGAFGKILGKQPDNVDSLERMAEIYEKKGSPKDAIVQLVSLARVFLAQKIMDRAETVLHKAIEMDGGHMEAHQLLGELFEMRGMKREAAGEYLVAYTTAKELNLATEMTQFEEKVRAIDPALLGPSAPAAVAEAPPPPAAAAAPPPPIAVAPPPPPPVAPPAPKAAVAPATPAPVSKPVAPPSPVARVAPAPAPVPVRPPVAPPPPPARPAPAAAPSAADFGVTASAAAPATPKPLLTPQQKAQRLINMAKGLIRMKAFDEAMAHLEDARKLVPDDPDVKSAIASVLKEYTRGATTAPVAAAPATPAAAAPAPPVVVAPTSAVPAAPPAPAPAAPAAAPALSPEDDIERRIRAEVERRLAQPKPASSSNEETRQHVLAQASLPDAPVPAPAAPSPPPPPIAAAPPPAAAKVQAASAMDETVSASMGDLYYAQGHFADAIKVYEAVLRVEPGRADVARRLKDCQAKLAPPPPVVPPPPPVAVGPAPAAVGAEPARARPRVSYV